MIKHTTKTVALCLSLAALTAPLHAEEYDTQSDQAEESQEEALRAYFENELYSKQTKIEDLEQLVGLLEQEKTELQDHCISRNRDVETTEQKIENLAQRIDNLEQEKTDLHNQLSTRNRDIETTEQKVETITNEIETLKQEFAQALKKLENAQKQLEQSKITLKKTERANAQLTQDVQDAQQKTDIGIPAGTIAGIVAGYFISGYFSK